MYTPGGGGVKTPYAFPISVMLKKCVQGGGGGESDLALKSLHTKWTTPYWHTRLGSSNSYVTNFWAILDPPLVIRRHQPRTPPLGESPCTLRNPRSNFAEKVCVLLQDVTNKNLACISCAATYEFKCHHRKYSLSSLSE